MSDQPQASRFLIYQTEDGELQPEATHKEYLLVRREGARDVQRRVAFYNRPQPIVVTVSRQLVKQAARQILVTLSQEFRKGVRA